MNVNEVLENSKKVMGPYCKSCIVCNGKACSNHIPGPGAKGSGTVAIRNYDAWQNIYIKMDTLVENNEVDCSLDLFGKTFKYPVFAGPVGAVAQHYSDAFNDNTYNEIIVRACANNGIAAFTGDGLNPEIMEKATHYIHKNNGIGIPTIKPWDKDTYFKKLQLAIDSGAFAVAMDIDAAGLPFLKGRIPPAGRKATAELKEIIDLTPVPFIVKGIMSVEGAIKAKEAGAKGIVVSNHGGRVLDGTPATAAVLGMIKDAIGDDIKILVDGGIRSGIDVYKALALGADAVIIARPFVNMVYGNQDDGVAAYIEKIGNELKDTMEMTGVTSLKDITRDKIYR